MKAVVFGFLLLGSGAWAQSVARVDTGTLNGARYRILIPANWQRKWVLYAHGYEFVGKLPAQSKDPGFLPLVQPFLDRGFAVAASDYRRQGFVLAEGVDDTETLRRYVVKTYGKPDTAFVVGHSMGGGVALGTLENFGANYQGALPLCPLSNRPFLHARNEFYFYTAFGAVFPGIAKPLSVIFDPSRPVRSITGFQVMARVTEISNALLRKDTLLVGAFARRFDLKPKDLAFRVFAIENALEDIAQKAGGNPFDNTNTVYSGFPDNLLVNGKVERLAATVSPAGVFGKYDRTGDIAKPVVLVHTMYDELIPPTEGVVHYENLVHQRGRGAFFTVKYTNGQRHCLFTPQETGRAFDELRTWAKTGRKAKPGYLD